MLNKNKNRATCSETKYLKRTEGKTRKGGIQNINIRKGLKMD